MLNIYLPCVSAMIFLVFIQEKEKHIHKNNCTRTFVAALFMVNITMNNLNVYQMENE